MSCCDNEHEDEIKDQHYRKILWLVLVLNLVMFGVETVASHISGSVSLLADALDFFGDAANYGISLYVLSRSITYKAKASFLKGGTMAVFGLYVLGSAVYRYLQNSTPDAEVMGAIGLLALLVNVGCMMLLYSQRKGDINRESVWICSRNDVIANIAVLLAAYGVYTTGSFWPDIIVAILIAALCLKSAFYVIRSALTQLHNHKKAG